MLSPEFWIAIGGQAVTIGVIYGMMKKTQDFHGEKFLEHAIRLKELDDDKVDLSLHTATVIRIDQSIIATSSRLDDTIRGVSHRVANVDQRVHGLEVKR